MIHCSADCRSKKVWQRAQVRNLSEDGMFVQTHKLEPPGTLVDLLFLLGKSPEHVIQAKAVVVWIRQSPQSSENTVPSGMGLQFTGVYSRTAREALRALAAQWQEYD